MQQEFLVVLKAETGLDALEHTHFPHGPVTVSMQDGSFFCWYDAFFLRDIDNLYVFTEHYGYHVFEKDIIQNANGPDEPKIP